MGFQILLQTFQKFIRRNLVEMFSSCCRTLMVSQSRVPEPSNVTVLQAHHPHLFEDSLEPFQLVPERLFGQQCPDSSTIIRTTLCLNSLKHLL